MHVETSAAVAVRGLYPVISSPAPVTSDSTLDCTSGGGEDQLWDIFSEHSLRYFIMNFSHTDLFYSRTFLTNLLLFFRTCSSQSSLNLMFWAERLQWSFHGKWRRKKKYFTKICSFYKNYWPQSHGLDDVLCLCPVFGPEMADCQVECEAEADLRDIFRKIFSSLHYCLVTVPLPLDTQSATRSFYSTNGHNSYCRQSWNARQSII